MMNLYLSLLRNAYVFLIFLDCDLWVVVESVDCPGFCFNLGDSGSHGMETFQGMLMKFYNCCEISFTCHFIKEVILILSNFIALENEKMKHIE